MVTQRAASANEMALANHVDPSQPLRFSDFPIGVRYIAAFLLTALATSVAIAINNQVAIPNLSLIYVIPVLLTAVAFGLGPSLCSAVLGALAYNFFFAPPLYTLQVEDPANIWAIVLLFIVGCIASAVASIARHRLDDAGRLKRQATLLRAYGRDIIAADSQKTLFSLTANALEALFGVPVMVMRLSNGSLEMVEGRGGLELAEEEGEAARYSLANNRRSPARTYPFDDSRFDFWPVSVADGRLVAIGLAFDPEDRPADPAAPAESVANLLALALDRRDLQANEAGQSAT